MDIQAEAVVEGRQGRGRSGVWAGAGGVRANSVGKKDRVGQVIEGWVSREESGGP